MTALFPAVATTAAATAWTQDYEAAKKQSLAGKKPILALFTGTDWCPACKQFEKDVAHDARFLNYAADKVVLLKLDFPRHMLQSPELIAQNTALAERIGGEEFPRFYLLDAKGEVLGKLGMRARRQVSGITEFYIQTLDEALAAAKQR